MQPTRTLVQSSKRYDDDDLFYLGGVRGYIVLRREIVSLRATIMYPYSYTSIYYAQTFDI